MQKYDNVLCYKNVTCGIRVGLKSYVTKCLYLL